MTQRCGGWMHLDARQRKRKRDSSQFVELERIYKAELELLRVQPQSEEAEGSAHNAEANWLAQQCRVLRLKSLKTRKCIVCFASMVCMCEHERKRSLLGSPVGYEMVTILAAWFGLV